MFFSIFSESPSAEDKLAELFTTQAYIPSKHKESDTKDTSPLLPKSQTLFAV